MRVAAVVAVIRDFLLEPQELVELAAVALETTLQLPHLETQILVVEAVQVVIHHQEQLLKLVALAAQASSSSRPINNEDKWKPKSIGCMELTPQCTC
jgi:hypothetical protein